MKTMYKLFMVLAVAAIIASCSSASKDNETQLKELKDQQKEIADKIKKLESEVKPEEKVMKSKEVVVEELTPAPFSYTVETQGGVEAEENLLISARTPGMVTSVFVREGQAVAAGQVLAQVDNSIILKNIEELKSGLELAKTVYDRQKSLWDQKIGTEIQFLQAKNNKESLEKRLATLNEQNEMTRIKSPINGTVDAVMVKAGENTPITMQAFRVIGLNNLKIVANVSEAYINDIKVGNPVYAGFMELGQKFNSKVSFVGKNINPLSRTFTVEVPIPAGTNARPNMSSTIKVTFNSIPNALAVPINIVQSINDKKIIYVVETENGKTVARKKIVEVGGIYDNKAEIKSGLTAGDKIITFGYQGLNDGELVKI